MPVARGPALALAACTAALYLAAFVHRSAWPLALIAHAPLAVAIRGRSATGAAGYGLVSGTLACSVGFAWIAGPIVRFGEVPLVVAWLAVLGVGLASGARFAVHAGAAAFAARRGSPPALAFVVAFAAAEACVPAVFPWTLAGAVAHVPLLVQTAELWGEVPIAALLLLPGGAVADVVCARIVGDLRVPRSAMWCAALGAFVLVYGAVRIPQIDRRVAASPRLRVGVVQPNLPLQASVEDDARALMREVELHDDLRQRGAELVVWPEGAIPGTLDANALDAPLREVVSNVPTLVGAVVLAGDHLPRNAVLAIEGRRVVGRYDKQLLLPFSETLPLSSVLPILRQWSPVSGRFVAGERAAPIVVAGHPVTAIVCCEDVVASQVRAVGAGRGELIVSLSNDAWFADPEPRLHLALARLRAVEQRQFLVRATNDGVSAVIDPVGRAVAETSERGSATLLVDVRWLAGRTPFDRYGGAIPWISAAALAALMALAGKRERRSRRDAGISPSANPTSETLQLGCGTLSARSPCERDGSSPPRRLGFR